MAYMRKLLILFALFLGCFFHTSVSVEAITDHTVEGHKIHPQKSLPRNVCLSFVTSLFEPFIEDAAKQKEELTRCGIAGYVSNIMTNIIKFVINNPSNAMAIGGGILSYTNMSEEGAFLAHLATGIACDIKNTQALWSCAVSLKDKNLAKFGFHGLAIVYALKSFIPVAYALTPTFGPNFQINHTPLSVDVPIAAATLKDGNNIFIWKDNNGYIIGRLFNNGTAVTNEFDVSLDPAFPSAIPSVASLTGGNFAVAWQKALNSIFASIFYPNGTSVGLPFPISQNTTYVSMNNPSVTGLKDGNAFFTWTSLTRLGTIFIPARIFSPVGKAVTNEFNVNQAVFNQGGYSSAVGLEEGGALVTWYGYNPTNLLGRGVFFNGTFESNQFIINKTELNGYDPTGGASTGTGVFIPYQSVSGLVARIVNQNSLSNEIPIGTGRGDGTSVTNLTNSNILVVWADAYVNGHVKGKTFDPTGRALTQELSIPGSNPGAFPPSTSGSNNTALVAWQDATNRNIYGAHISNSSKLTPPWLIWPVTILAWYFTFQIGEENNA